MPCHAGLAAPGGRTIRLDRLLHGSLFNKKEAEGEGSEVPEAALRKRLLDKLQLHHRLVRPSDQVRESLPAVARGRVRPAGPLAVPGELAGAAAA